MDYFSNEYAVPVMIGRDNAAFCLRELVLKRGIRPHVFSDRFNILQKLFCCCHRVIPFDDKWIAESLVSFADELEEYKMAVFICADEKTESFFKSYSDMLEPLYVCIGTKEIINLDRRD